MGNTGISKRLLLHWRVLLCTRDPWHDSEQLDQDDQAPHSGSPPRPSLGGRATFNALAEYGRKTNHARLLLESFAMLQKEYCNLSTHISIAHHNNNGMKTNFCCSIFFSMSTQRRLKEYCLGVDVSVRGFIPSRLKRLLQSVFFCSGSYVVLVALDFPLSLFCRGFPNW